MSKGPDNRLAEGIIGAINSSHPELISQEKIYQYLETTIDFTEQQKKLHHQIRGQIEPNWQHDARNLIHSLKRDGKIIGPVAEHYCLPLRPPLERSWHDKIWKEIYQTVEDGYRYGAMKFATSERDIIVSLAGQNNSNQTIRESLVRERVDHLVQCGGHLQIGSFHKWNLLARGMIALHPHLSLKVDKEIQYVDIDDEFAQLVRTGSKRMIDNTTEVVRDTDAVTSRTVSRSEYGVENMAVSNTEPKYVMAALNPEHTWDDEGELIHIQSCPPVGSGGPQVYCPTCGQKFVSTSNEGKVFFRHYSHFGSYRKHEWIWPADAEDTWGNARKTGWLNRTWGFARIHRNLGFDDAPNSSQILEAKSRYKKKQSRYQIPVFIENSGGDNWNFWVISKPNEKMKAGFNIENALEKIPGVNGEYWFRIGDISKPTTIEYEDGEEEEVKWPIPIDSYSPVILSMNSGTLNHERFRYGDAESGHYYRRSSNGKCDALIGGVKFIKYKRADFVQFEIALPTINGSIPWLNTGQIIPINVKNALSDVTHLNPLQNIDAFGIRGDVHLNVDEFVQSYSTRKPAIEMRQTEDKGSSAKSLITLYPAHYIPVPEPAYISVDGIKSPIHTACIVEQVPEEISLSSESGKNYDLFERKCSVTYSVKDDETDLKWLRKEGQVKEILDFLRELEAESFSISITPNSRKMYDWIQITKLLPPTAELESEPKIEDDIIEEESPLEVEVDPPKIAGIQEREKDKFDHDSPKNLPPSNLVGVCRKCNSPTCRRSGMQSCIRRAKRWIKKWGGES